ncbi:MAG TPA: class F sortase [Thermomicrobiales bacterium]|nr:class F sortase [Thermomicrobiales bacterium]
MSAALAVLTLLAMLGASLPAVRNAVAQDSIEEASQIGEPTTLGGVRPGPNGAEPQAFRKRGVAPIAIQIANAEVDAQVEQQEIVDGVMQNPSGPWVVAWYRGTGRLGEDDNIVMAGHLDYWDVGPAVFYHVGDLKENDEIDVTGEDDAVYKYKVDWVKNYSVADLDSKAVHEIVGATDTETLTLITCGGPFDSEKGEYLERIVIRASRLA